MKQQPSWYAWAALVVATAASVGLNAVVGIGLAERSIEAEREAAEANRRATCTLIKAQIEVYRETPPTLATGQNVERSWKEMSTLFRCDQGGTK